VRIGTLALSVRHCHAVLLCSMTPIYRDRATALVASLQAHRGCTRDCVTPREVCHVQQLTTLMGIMGMERIAGRVEMELVGRRRRRTDDRNIDTMRLVEFGGMRRRRKRLRS